jgi:hypothetical protein
VSHTSEISRRRFLALVAAAAAAVTLSGSSAAVASRHERLAARLAGIFDHPASAGVVGREYLRAYPAEAGAEQLVAAIAAAIPGGIAALISAPRQDLRGLLDRATREDFTNDRIVTLQGWVLSATEARLYALAALV